MVPKYTPLLSFVLLTLIFASCKKDHSTAAPSYTSKMGGMRNWHGSHYYSASGIHFPTPVYESYNYPDTSFALTIVDGNSIQFWGNIYTIDTVNSSDSVRYFGGAYYYYEYGMESGVAYFPAADSIVYCSGDRHATSDQWVLRDLYYTYK